MGRRGQTSVFGCFQPLNLLIIVNSFVSNVSPLMGRYTTEIEKRDFVFNFLIYFYLLPRALATH